VPVRGDRGTSKYATDTPTSTRHSTTKTWFWRHASKFLLFHFTRHQVHQVHLIQHCGRMAAEGLELSADVWLHHRAQNIEFRPLFREWLQLRNAGTLLSHSDATLVDGHVSVSILLTVIGAAVLELVKASSAWPTCKDRALECHLCHVDSMSEKSRQPYLAVKLDAGTWDDPRYKLVVTSLTRNALGVVAAYFVAELAVSRTAGSSCRAQQLAFLCRQGGWSTEGGCGCSLDGVCGKCCAFPVSSRRLILHRSAPGAEAKSGVQSSAINTTEGKS
jgi:hypothetical protein